MKDFYSFTTEYGTKDELFKAVLSLDKPRVEQLKAQGVTLTENVKQTLVNGGGSMVSSKPAAPFWYLYLTDLEGVGKEDFVWISRTFFEETRAPLYYSDSLENVIAKYFFNNAVFTCLLECYNLKKLNKTRTLKEIIRKNNIPILELCAKHGWLKQSNKRDEMINYANEQNLPECTAWLLDFKNRTADLKAERAKAEKKAERELNAAPDSALELGKLWSWKKQEDGTLIITSYKGEETEVTVPVKIGNNIVTAVGEYALSSLASRANNIVSRLFIEKIIVPNGIKTIGKKALGGSGMHGKSSRLKEVVLPETLDIFTDRQAAEAAPKIVGNDTVVAVVPNSENAELYCIKNNILYRFADSEDIHVPMTEIIKSDELYSAILVIDKEKIAELKSSGAVLTDCIKKCLLHEMRYDMEYGSVLRGVQDNFLETVTAAADENRRFILSSLKAETGEPLYFDKYKYSQSFAPEFFDCILEYYNTKFLNKTQEMQRFIHKEKTEHLAVCAKHGWLKNATTRDKIIQYAIDNNKTEATAWLLDYKNRTTTPEQEKKRAEKKLERELNAAPPTEEELREKADKLFKRMFTYEIADGEVTITGYKGKDDEVKIPREFEGKPIIAISRQAFSPNGKGVPTEHRHRRANIKKVVIPDTVRTIETAAFILCNALQEMTLPASVSEIGFNAFYTTSTITFTVERGSFAESYCKRNGEKIAYKENR